MRMLKIVQVIAVSLCFVAASSVVDGGLDHGKKNRDFFPMMSSTHGKKVGIMPMSVAGKKGLMSMEDVSELPSTAPSTFSSPPSISLVPSQRPSNSVAPSQRPSGQPSLSASPSSEPSSPPSGSLVPSQSPSSAPSFSNQPSNNPSFSPSNSISPSESPSSIPSASPTSSPSSTPSTSVAPSVSAAPSSSPSISQEPTIIAIFECEGNVVCIDQSASEIADGSNVEECAVASDILGFPLFIIGVSSSDGSPVCFCLAQCMEGDERFLNVGDNPIFATDESACDRVSTAEPSSAPSMSVAPSISSAPTAAPSTSTAPSFSSAPTSSVSPSIFTFKECDGDTLRAEFVPDSRLDFTSVEECADHCEGEGTTLFAAGIVEEVVAGMVEEFFVCFCIEPRTSSSGGFIFTFVAPIFSLSADGCDFVDG